MARERESSRFSKKSKMTRRAPLAQRVILLQRKSWSALNATKHKNGGIKVIISFFPQVRFDAFVVSSYAFRRELGRRTGFSKSAKFSKKIENFRNCFEKPKNVKKNEGNAFRRSLKYATH